MASGWLALPGLLSGFAGRKAEIEQQNLVEAQASQQRESKVFEALINSPDPEISSMAVAGLLHSAQPGQRKSGLRGWLGEMQGSPFLPKIQALLNQPTQVEEPVSGLPSKQTSGYISEPPGQTGSLAQPDSSPTEVGAPPPRQVETNLTTQSVAAPNLGTRTVSRPRQVFRTPEQVAIGTARGKARGDVEGDVEGYRAVGLSDEESVAQVRAERLRNRGAVNVQSVSGEAPDATGKFIPAFGVFDKDPTSPTYGQYLHPTTKAPIPGFRPHTGASNYRYGQNREALSRDLFGKNFADLAPPEVAEVMTREQALIKQTATSRSEGTNAAVMTKPIGVGEAQRTNTVVGTTPADYAGQEVPSTQEQDQRRGVQSVKTQLDHIRTLLVALPKSTDLGGLAPGASLALRRRTPSTRNQVAALEAAIDNVVNVLARTVGQQRGAQTEQDATRAYNTVVSLKARLLDPLAGDTQESAAARIDETQRYLDTVLQALPGTPVPVKPKTPGAGAAGAAGAAGVGAPPPGASASPDMPMAYKDAQGVWRIKQPAALQPQPQPQP